MPDSVLNIINEMNIAQLVAIGIMIWISYNRLNGKIERSEQKLEKKIGDLENRIGSVEKRLNNVENRLSIIETILAMMGAPIKNFNEQKQTHKMAL